MTSLEIFCRGGKWCSRPHGFTYIELIIALLMASLIVLGLSGVVGQALQSQAQVSSSNQLTRQARLAMQSMVRYISHSGKLLLPLEDNPATDYPENIREQTVPPSAPIGSSTLATAVLAVSLPNYIDLDGNGVADADNDGDGRIDEDLPADSHNDIAPGLYQIDDDGNGVADFFLSPDGDDDESNNLSQSEDGLNGADDDGDGSIDEDPGADTNADGCAGICGVDDDGDGSIDEGSIDDDDEDGQSNEDWYDPLVIYLDNGVLKQRMPVPWDENGASGINGRDFVISDIADNVVRFRVERLAQSDNRAETIDLILELNNPVTGESVSLQSQVRIGGAL